MEQAIYEGDQKVLQAQGQPFPIYRVRMMDALTKYFFKALSRIQNRDEVNNIVEKIRSSTQSLTSKCSNGGDQSKILIKLIEALAISYNEAYKMQTTEALKQYLTITIFPFFQQWCSMIAKSQSQREVCISTLVDVERKIRQNSNADMNKEIYFNFLVVVIKLVLDILQNFITAKQYDKVIFCFGESQGLINAAKSFSFVNHNTMMAAENLKDELYSIKRCAVCLHNLNRCASLLQEKGSDSISASYQALDLLQEANEMCEEGDEYILAQIYGTIAHVWWKRLHSVDDKAEHAFSYLQKCQQLFENFDSMECTQEDWYKQVQLDLTEITKFRQEFENKEEGNFSELENKLLDKLNQGIKNFLHYIYSEIPQKKSLDLNLSTQQKLKKARIHFHPDTAAPDLKTTYSEISKILNQKYQEMYN